MATKTAVHYRRGDGDHQCGECSMFRAPHRCTAVTGYIRPVDLCDLFERKQDYADGGSVKAMPFRIPDDVIRKLGGGDMVRGYATAHEIFKLKPGEPLGQIPAETVAAIGGSPSVGRQVLNKFIARIRAGKRKVAIAPDGEFDAVAARTEN